ncbi:MAG: hypothetical protein RMM08_01590 [Armatimonadota bacterium]|nr:DUF4380 domain-containing protein [bacterium]MDW8320030.1 hypothetical protein [Armatimonadota bacterium]
MRRDGVRCVVLLLCMGAVCAFAWAQKVERVSYRGWQDSYRLSNGTVEVIVVPSIARIMHYGFAGEPNTLWVNPATEGKPVKPGEWLNHGGDKAWVWPQDEWPQRIGRGWPPPSATDQVPHQVEIVNGNVVRLSSPLVAGYGVRVVREVRLEPSGTRVHILTRLEKLRDGADFPVAAWVVAQLPVPDLLLVRLYPGSTLSEGYKLFSLDAWKAVRRLAPDILLPERRSEVAVKLGCDAEVLAWFKSPYLVVHRSPISDLADFRPGDHAQIFSNSDALPYIELEFTSPLKVLRKGESVSLEVTWELHRVPPGKQSPEGLAVFLRDVGE